MRLQLAILCLTIALTPVLQAQTNTGAETGYASYYANYLDGRRTAYGEVYDKNKLTAAHKTYPLGTLIKVTRQDNGKSIIVRVNDKGPFKEGRIVDVSGAAAEALGLVYDGIAMVTVQVVDKDGNPIPPPRPEPVAAQAPTAYDQVEVPVSYDYKPQFKQPETTTTTKSGIPSSSLPPAEPASSPYRQDLQPKTPLPAASPSEYGPTSGGRLTTAPATGYFVQLGAFSKRANAENLLNQLSAKGINNAQIQSSGSLFKALVGPYDSPAAAKQELPQLNQTTKMKGFVTKVE